MCAGSLIPSDCVAPLTHTLSQDSARTYTEKHHQSLQSAVSGLRASSSSSASNRAQGGSNGLPHAPGDPARSEPGPASRPAEPVLSMPTFDF